MRMNDNELSALADSVREQGLKQEASMTQLVYDSQTGEFRQITRGTQPLTGEIVTDMTENGFACSPVIYLSKQDVLEFASDGGEVAEGYSYEWEGEQVVHLSLKKALHAYGDADHILFATSTAAVNEDYTGKFCIIVRAEDDVHVYEKVNGELIPRAFEYIPAKDELYSRSKGILEVNVLEGKRVMIVGLGSFGSQIAIELAKAGVGSYSLWDFDRVELHNLARHTCGIQELGRLKTNAIEDAILAKNPYARVDKFAYDISQQEELMREEVGKADLVICATDNNASRFILSKALVDYQKVGIFGRAITRAEGGDVFRYRPGGPCYCCLIGNHWFNSHNEEIADERSARRSGAIPAYMSSEDADAVVQVGLSSDIQPICNMMVKLALVELSSGSESGISSLEDELVYDYYMWANRRERHYANWAALPGAGNMPTIMRWYGARIDKNPSCAVCSPAMSVLDLGEDIEAKLEGQIELTDIDFELN